MLVQLVMFGCSLYSSNDFSSNEVDSTIFRKSKFKVENVIFRSKENSVSLIIIKTKEIWFIWLEPTIFH